MVDFVVDFMWAHIVIRSAVNFNPLFTCRSQSLMMILINRSGMLNVESVMACMTKVSMANIIVSVCDCMSTIVDRMSSIVDRMRDHLSLNYSMLVCWSQMQMGFT